MDATIRTDGGTRVVDALEAHGVTCVFTLCGGHISPILVAAKARGLRVLDMRDEATAVFAADAHARLTGIPGVAAVTAGPGVTNTITAVKNAQLAQSPVVVIGGAAPTALKGRGALQDIDQRSLMAPLVKRVFTVRAVRELAPALDAALRLARDGVPGPVFVECPVDLLYEERLIREWYAQAAGRGTSLADRFVRGYLERHVARLFKGAGEPFVPAGPASAGAGPREAPLTRAADRLGASQRPLMLIGSQAVVDPSGVRALVEAVERLGIPVYLSGMARGLLGRDHPLQRRHARREALRESDCVLLAGVPCDFRLDYGKHVRRSATLIAANRSARDARLNRTPTVTALGDAGRFVAALGQRLGEGARREDWLATLRARDEAREAEIDRQGAAEGELVNPIAFFRALDRAAGDGAVFVADGGDFVATASYVLRPRSPLSWLDPGAFGTLGVGAGFAAGASVARPGAEVWLLWGDGASGYGLAEIDTFARHGIPVIAIVGNDASWAQIAREQVKMLGDDVGTVLARTAYHDVARGFGAEGIELKRPGDVPEALAAARRLAAAGRPVLLNVWLEKTAFREGSISM